YFVLMKRLMLRVAEKLAEKKGIDFLITGENLGQVSSQTLSNLASIDSSVKIPVLRPLISFEKQEIIDFSKKIGTHDISVGPEMCDVLGPDKVAVKSSEKKLNELEKEINMKELLKDLLNSNSIN
ncbi:MAG TPA: tRNA 4-thiouridine(8) synthase ThiI, partial [archaeon]|nr:tRNA 4-thiouridine(8) synthase ThiI [archaeon]